MASGRAGDSFREFLRGLPDDIARLEEDTGEPFVVELPERPPEHIQRLFAALGAKWTVAPRQKKRRRPPSRKEHDEVSKITTIQCDGCKKALSDEETAAAGQLRLKMPRADFAADLCEACISDLKGQVDFQMKGRTGPKPKLREAAAA